MARTKQAMRRPRTVKPLHQSLIECIEDNDVNGLRGDGALDAAADSGGGGREAADAQEALRAVARREGADEHAAELEQVLHTHAHTLAHTTHAHRCSAWAQRQDSIAPTRPAEP